MNHYPPLAIESLRDALKREDTGEYSQVQRAVMETLGAIGPTARAAIPDLQDIAANNETMRPLVILELSRLEPDNLKWNGELRRLLKSFPKEASWALGQRGKLAREALSEIRQVAETAQHSDDRAVAALAAWRIDPASLDPFAVVSNHFSNPNRGSLELVERLGELGPDARPAVPTLLKLRYRRSSQMRESAIDALRKIAPEYVSDPWRK